MNPPSLPQVAAYTELRVVAGGESCTRAFLATDPDREWCSKFLSSLAPSVSPSVRLQAASQPTINPFSLVQQQQHLMCPWGIRTADQWEMWPIIYPLKQFTNPLYCQSTLGEPLISTDIWLAKQVTERCWISTVNIEDWPAAKNCNRFRNSEV